MHKKIIGIYRDNLFQNSLHPMLAIAILATFGFFFWLISARLFSEENIGLATTLISVVVLIGTLSQMGFDMAFVRYLANSKQRNETLNTGIIIVTITSILLSIFFALSVNIISPKLALVLINPIILPSFIAFCAIIALNILIDSIFLANRQTKFTLINTFFFSAIKMFLPFAFSGYGVIGIFIAATLAHGIGLALNISALIKHSEYKPQLIIKKDVLVQYWKYCATNYIAGVLNLLPTALLPIIVINNLGPDIAAYYYMAMMIGTLLYTIPQATTRSLLSEGSRDEFSINHNTVKSIKIIGVLMTPAIIVIIMLGNIVLGMFGKNYSAGGIDFLRILAISGVAVSAYFVYGSLFRIKEDLPSIMIVNIIYAAATLYLSYSLLSHGLLGIGIAWLGGYITASIASAILWAYRSANALNLKI